MQTSKSLHRAYERLDPDYAARTDALCAQLDKLLRLSQQVPSKFLRKLKPAIVISLKWKFDYLFKTLESPFEMEADVAQWIRMLEIFKRLGHLGWFEMEDLSLKVDAWDRTAQGFDLGWTTTTEGERFKASRPIAKERTDQFLEMLGGPGYIKGKDILDSGCGPGRYIDVLREYDPKSITGMDQGVRLIEVLKDRFKEDSRVEIVKGTCEKLEFSDNSFDFVLSNGVIHHTSADLKTMLEDHARVLRPGGAMFIMLVGKGGLELKIWEFLRNFLNDVPLQEMIGFFDKSISPLRMQGIVDHMYGEYQETSQEQFESWCAGTFTRIERVAGVEGLDVTRELYQHDPYYTARFGCGNLRYLCYK